MFAALIGDQLLLIDTPGAAHACMTIMTTNTKYDYDYEHEDKYEIIGIQISAARVCFWEHLCIEIDSGATRGIVDFVKGIITIY